MLIYVLILCRGCSGYSNLKHRCSTLSLRIVQQLDISIHKVGIDNSTKNISYQIPQLIPLYLLC